MGQAPNKGGTVRFGGIRSHADRREPLVEHDDDGTFVYLGEPCGVVLRLDDGPTIYFAGDTNVFGDMALDPAALRAGRRGAADRRPLHDGAGGGRGRGGARRRTRVVPSHYGTFPLLTGTPEALRQLLPPGVELLAPEPGETIEL